MIGRMLKATALLLAGGMLMAATEPTRALSLQVEEQPARVAIDLVADSPTMQKVDYIVELTGASRSRHAGSTVIPANERRVLSRMSAAVGGEWCARVTIREASGLQYDLTAGDCAPAPGPAPHPAARSNTSSS